MGGVTTGLTCLLVLVCWNLGEGDILKKNGDITPPHVFHDPEFWRHFESQVRSRFFSTHFPRDLLLDTLEKDSVHYTDDSVFRRRRQEASKWTGDPSKWIEVALGVCRERADGARGPHSKVLEELHMLEPLEDYVDHLGYFQRVASVMKDKGQEVHPFSQNSSGVHDIDKLDPFMVVGYAEKFEDGRDTSLWNLCVDRHTTTNPHHQAHCLWHDSCKEKFDEKTRDEALKEMVCDKVARRLQKNLDGEVSDAMWDVEVAFFGGMPQQWVDRAVRLMQSLKGSATPS